MKDETYYIMVTKDEYELPLAVAVNAGELSRMTNYPIHTIYSYISKKLGKFYKVTIPADLCD